MRSLIEIVYKSENRPAFDKHTGTVMYSDIFLLTMKNDLVFLYHRVLLDLREIGLNKL